MARKLLIVHGYSDGSTSFEGLRDFFHGRGHRREEVFLLDYSSMDDEATFEDFADKLDADYERLFPGEAIDVACHSTGALVVRAWLALRHARSRARAAAPPPSPVRHLLMFAPANFGSDLARMGQSLHRHGRALLDAGDGHGHLHRHLEPHHHRRFRLVVSRRGSPRTRASAPSSGTFSQRTAGARNASPMARRSARAP